MTAKVLAGVWASEVGTVEVSGKRLRVDFARPFTDTPMIGAVVWTDQPQVRATAQLDAPSGDGFTALVTTPNGLLTAGTLYWVAAGFVS